MKIATSILPGKSEVLAYLGTEGIPPPLEHYHLDLLKVVVHPLGDTHNYSLCNQLLENKRKTNEKPVNITK